MSTTEGLQSEEEMGRSLFSSCPGGGRACDFCKFPLKLLPVNSTEFSRSIEPQEPNSFFFLGGGAAEKRKKWDKLSP